MPLGLCSPRAGNFRQNHTRQGMHDRMHSEMFRLRVASLNMTNRIRAKVRRDSCRLCLGRYHLHGRRGYRHSPYATNDCSSDARLLSGAIVEVVGVEAILFAAGGAFIGNQVVSRNDRDGEPFHFNCEPFLIRLGK